MSNIRTLRNKTSGVTISFDLTNVAHLMQYEAALETGVFLDDDELSDSTPHSEDELRAEIATLRSEYEALEMRQDEIQMEIRKLAKQLPEDASFSFILVPY